MFRSFTIRNFRCFREMSVERLERINLFGGKNNSGKTALLEAIHLFGSGGRAELAFELNASRGIIKQRQTTKDVCSWLFHGGDTAQPIEMAVTDEKNRQGALKIWIFQRAAEEQQQMMLQNEKFINHSRQELYLSGYPCLTSHFISTEGSQTWTSLLLDIERPHPPSYLAHAGNQDRPDSLLLTSSERFSSESLEYFSTIEAAGRQEELLVSLRHLEPRLRRLSVLVTKGEAVLHGEVGQKRLIPMHFMGEGIQRLLSMVLAITNCPGGTVLIDEIENGLHYSVLRQVWQAIAIAARQANVQVFATTHSFECIQAAHQSFKENPPYEFRYFRLDRRGEEIVAKGFDEDMLDTVQESDLEIR